MTAVLEMAPDALNPETPDDSTGFKWRCRVPVDDPTGEFVKRECGAGGTDRDEFTAHFKGTHGLRGPKSAYARWKPWKPPRPVKEYTPKPGAPGTRVTWLKRTGGHWSGRECDGHGLLSMAGDWVPEKREERSGTVWSAGTTSSELWACPDDDPQRPVLIKRHGRKFSLNYKEGDLYEIPGWGDEVRVAVLRGELVRQRGIFAVTDFTYSDQGRKKTFVKWHSDPGCPKAQGKEAYDREAHGTAYGYSHVAESRFGGCYGGGPWTPADVAAALTRGGRAPYELCEECIVNLPVLA